MFLQHVFLPQLLEIHSDLVTSLFLCVQDCRHKYDFELCQGRRKIQYEFLQGNANVTRVETTESSFTLGRNASKNLHFYYYYH